MQILVKVDNKTITIDDVTVDNTISEVIAKIAQKLVSSQMPVPVDKIRLSYQNTLLTDYDRTVGQLGIGGGAFLTLSINKGGPFPDNYDATVKPILANDLMGLRSVTSPFVFIGLGSYDNEHGTASIKRQQCPDDLREICRQEKWQLHVLLIDVAFGEAPSPYPQIYDIDKNWMLAKQEAGGKVRRYSYRGQDFQLWIYGTNVLPAEYDGKMLTIAGIDLRELAKEILAQSGSIVVGNFYDKNTPPHLAEGNPTALKDLGYSKK